MHQHKEIEGGHTPQAASSEQAETVVASGLKTSRIEALSDGICAVAMTLLVFGITPELKLAPGANPVIALFQSQGISLFSYLMSFAILSVYWVGHHAQFQYIERANRPLLWINLALLFFISFVPFSTSFLAQHVTKDHGLAASSVAAFYGLHLLMIGALLYVHWWYAARTPLLTGRLDPHLVKAAARRILIAPGMILPAIALAFIHPLISLVCYALIPVAYVFPSHIDLHWTGPDADHAHEHESGNHASEEEA
jgi:uncharacterized membrane protein